MILNVTVRDYKNSVLKKYGVIPESPVFTSTEDQGQPPPIISTTLSLHMVNEIIITPSTLSIFNHPGNKEIVSIKQGSGYFELALSDTDIALIRYLETSKEIEVIPMKSGELTVQVIDLCLATKPANILISVVSVGIIRVEMADKVGLFIFYIIFNSKIHISIIN